MNDVFSMLFGVFLILGTAVGAVVISYMVYNAYKYRDREGRDGTMTDPLQLGELPQGGGDGKKLAISLAISAIIVIALIGWAYVLLVDVEAGAPASENPIEIKVEGIQFSWQYEYPNGHTTSTLRVPEDRPVTLTVTSGDVFHTFGIPAFDLKADAIPGQTTQRWFRPNETGTYRAQCFELCGSGHSVMESDVIVMEPNEYEQWYANTGADAPAMNNSAAAVSTTKTRIENGGAEASSQRVAITF
ncbi:cytochrome c oxidase subunit II [Halocatena pleomorpha]|nr:cytochrome c oxidase subunit II [Halocatena pleomorpha]